MVEYRSKEIYGDFYENKGKPLAVIIGGSRAGLPAPLNEELLRYLKSKYSILLLAYFGVETLTETLQDVPMEYFVNAINFIKEKYKIDEDKVIIIGQSKGGEAALLLTNYIKSAVTIACVPGCYVFQGLPKNLLDLVKAEPKSSWSFDNKELPYIRFYIDEEVIEHAKNGDICMCYEKSIAKNFNKDALINIDNYQGKILFLSAEKDKYWPSKKMSNILIENSSHKNNLTHISLDLEGHYFLNYSESVSIMINYLNRNARF